MGLLRFCIDLCCFVLTYAVCSIYYQKKIIYSLKDVMQKIISTYQKALPSSSLLPSTLLLLSFHPSAPLYTAAYKN
jgi:hypothetical protein